MQMFMLVRGFQDRLQRWLNDCMAQHYDWKGEDGKVHKVRMMIRPVQLIDVAFPETAYNDVLATLMPYQAPWGGLQAYTFALRKMLGLKPIGRMVAPNFKVDNNFVQRVGIGVKKDAYHPDGWEML